jgi:hypothetical protein
MKKKKSQKGWFITHQTYRSSKGTSYVRSSTKRHPLGAGQKKVVYRKKKKK